MKTLTSFDTTLSRLVALLPKWLQRPFEILGLCTSPLVWTSAVVVAALVLQPSNYQPFVMALVCMPLASISKFAFKRQRPPTIYAGNMRIKSYSFPSSHAYSSALGCCFLSIVAANQGVWYLAFILAPVAITVGVSRVFVGAHYPSDVIAGLLLGLMAGIGVTRWL